jgi:Ca-activated chloride channel homolog
MKTGILIDHGPVDGGRVVRVLLKVEAEAPAHADRLPLNLSLVLDRSGSMHGEKLEAARAAAALLVRRLAPEDLVSVVAYDDAVHTVAEPAKGAAQATLPRQIEQIETGGSTNLSGGWLRGRRPTCWSAASTATPAAAACTTSRTPTRPRPSSATSCRTSWTWARRT